MAVVKEDKSVILNEICIPLHHLSSKKLKVKQGRPIITVLSANPFIFFAIYSAKSQTAKQSSSLMTKTRFLVLRAIFISEIL